MRKTELSLSEPSILASCSGDFFFFFVDLVCLGLLLPLEPEDILGVADVEDLGKASAVLVGDDDIGAVAV